MPSIFNQTDNDAIIARINNLAPASKAAWGKMNVTQMCKHTNEALMVAFGEKTVAVPFIFRLFGRLMKDKIFNSEFKKNSPTAREFIFTDEYDFETVKNELIKNYRRFTEGHQSIKITKHPFWGDMSYDDWNKLMWNHVDHHLRQFNA
tara:strand:+ start:752 stop:1195 length:444 start_codon:yes stop_codon:yes gene_type:complete